MSLGRYPIRATVVVADIAPAVAFYEGALGLEPAQAIDELVRIYACGDGTLLQVYASPDHVGKATGTVATWIVDDLDAVVAELAGRGLTFEQYAAPIDTDSRGVHDAGYVRLAWFCDPDGNTFSLEQPVAA